MAEGIRIGGGKKSGAYVWKKCEYFPEHTLTSASFKIASTDGKTFNITDANFNLLSIKEETNFLVGFTNGTVYFSLVNNRLALQVNEAAYVNSITVSKDGKSAVVIVGAAIGTGTFTLSCANKTIPSVIGELIDFVVSDNPTAYPDGGEQGGYWYEKFQLDPAFFGCTKYVVDKFTLASDATVTSTTYTFNHSLEEKPKFVFLLSPGIEKGNYKYLTKLCGMSVLFSELSGSIAADCIYSYLYEESNTLRLEDTEEGTMTVKESSITVGFGSNVGRIKGGQEYTLITMA